MRGWEARSLLGFLPNSHPTPSQVKEAYKRKAWETHPDRFPTHEKSHAECRFKLISEAYTCLHSGNSLAHIHSNLDNSFQVMVADSPVDYGIKSKRLQQEASTTGTYYSRVVKTGVPRAQGGRKYHAFVGLPFLLIVLGTVALGGSIASRAYKRQKEAHPSHNPFLP